MSTTFDFTTARGSTDVANLPAELKELDVWVVEDGRQPCYPSWKWRNSDEPTTSFEDAKAEFERRQGSPRAGDGLGIILEPSLDLVVIDGDNVVNDSGEVFEPYQQILDEAGTYSEYSSSGTGIHTLFFGVSGLIEDRSMKHDDFEREWACGEVPHIDLFGSQEAKNIVLTGDMVGENRSIRESPEFVRELHSQFPKSQTDSTSGQVQESIDGEALSFDSQEDYTVADIRATVEQYAEYGSGKSQSRAEKILALWDSTPARNPRDASTRSETVSGKRYNSPSEADYDFVTGLAYYCRHDKALIRDCWQDSSRWSRPEKEKSPTYYHKTIENAVAASGNSISPQNIADLSE